MPSGTQAIDRAAQLLVARRRERRADRRRRAGRSRRAAQEHGLARCLEPRAPGLVQRAGAARRSARPGAAALRPPRRRRATTSSTLARAALERLGERSGETVDLAVPGARAGRAHRPGRQPPLPRHRQLGRPPRRYHMHRASARCSWPTAPPSCRAGGCARRARHDHRPRACSRPSSSGSRATRFATAVGELEPGLVAVAAPVHGATATSSPRSRSRGRRSADAERIAELGRLLHRGGRDARAPARSHL